MSKSYWECGPEVQKMIAEILREHHTDLAELKVSISAIFVRKTDKDGVECHALSRHGVPAAAVIKLSSTEDRARGLADAKITIDGFGWDKCGIPTRRAIIDHELTHLTISDVHDPTDEAGRPKLSMRVHDWEIWGFDDIARRYGIDAPEVQAASKVREERGQLLLWPTDAQAHLASRLKMKIDQQPEASA